MQASLLQQGLELMFFGMGMVFLFLACLVLVTSLMSALLQGFVTAEPVPEASDPAALGTGQDDKLLAAITAAVHSYRSRHKP